MRSSAGVAWDSPLLFSRYIEDCGVHAEPVTPQLLAAPFFRGNFTTLIIPTGFANPDYSNLLPALRASEVRINRFLKSGGRLLVFGAAATGNSYDWLPFSVTYTYEYGCYEVEGEGEFTELIEGYDEKCISCDGWFPEHEGLTALHSQGKAVLIKKRVGEGIAIVTSVHEYPSRTFLRTFCTSQCETLF